MFTFYKLKEQLYNYLMDNLKLFTFFVIKEGSSIQFQNIEGIPVEQVVSDEEIKATNLLKEKYKDNKANVFKICSQGIKEINSTVPKEQTSSIKKKEFFNQIRLFSDKFVKSIKDKEVLSKMITKYGS